MGRLGLVCLILAQILVVRAMAEESKGSELKPFQNEVGKLGVVIRVAAQPVSSSADQSSEGEEDSKVAEAPVIRRLGKQKKHHSDHKSDVAGGGVIIGGLVTAIFAIVFCYIRVTRRKDDVH